MYNYYDTVFDGRTANFTAANRAAVTGDGLTSFDFTNASLALSQNHSHKVVDTTTVSPKLEYRRNNLLVDAAFNYSISTNQYVGSAVPVPSILRQRPHRPRAPAPGAPACARTTGRSGRLAAATSPTSAASPIRGSTTSSASPRMKSSRARPAPG